MRAFDDLYRDVLEQDEIANLAIGGILPSTSPQRAAARSEGALGSTSEGEHDSDSSGPVRSSPEDDWPGQEPDQNPSGDDGIGSASLDATLAADADKDARDHADLPLGRVDLGSSVNASGPNPNLGDRAVIQTDQGANAAKSDYEWTYPGLAAAPEPGPDPKPLPNPELSEASAASGGNIEAPAATATLSTLANYLNDQDAAGLDFWDEIGVPQSPFFNLTSSGANAKYGVIFYTVDGFSGISGAGTDSDGISAARADMIRHALNIYEDILGIDFVETTSTSSNAVDIYFKDNVFTSTGGNRAFANFEQGADGSISHAWVSITPGWNGGNSAIGTYAFQTALHEIGHVLGLGHQGIYNAGSGAIVYADDAKWQNDSWQQTMMSYFDQTENTDIAASYARLIGPMAVDWLALEAIYGPQGYGVANGVTTGDTTWGFNGSWYGSVPSSSGPALGYSNSAYAAMSTMLDTNAICIVDGGGIDTLDLSGFSDNTVIDVSEALATSTTGSISSVAGLTGNLTIAAGTIIENVLGGAGGETVIGNDADNDLKGNGGNDTLYGGNNDDKLYGGRGADKVYGQDGADRLYADTGNDELDGGTGADWLCIKGSTNSVVNLAKTTAQSTGFGKDIIRNIEHVSGGKGVDRLYGTESANTLKGNNGNDILKGKDGSDRLYGGSGNDNLFGGNSNDILKGDTGKDRLQGGDGRDYLYAGADTDRDVMVFKDISETANGTQRDRIYQFHSGEDDIHLRSIDANLSVDGDQSFLFSEFGAAANSVWVKDKQANLLVRGDVDGDALYDFEILVVGVDSLYANDFVL